MKSYEIHKEPLQKNFVGIHSPTLGEATGCLSLAGLRLYLYLANNADNTNWTVNPSVFAQWCGIDYSNSSQSRKVRKWIEDGTNELIA